MLGRDGVSPELTRALGAVVGLGEGPGGFALKGNGGGGELGGPLSLGRLGTRHAPGRDPKLSEKTSVGPELTETPPLISCGQTVCPDKELIRRVVREHLAQVRYCYEQLLPRAPNLEGRVVMKWHVTGAGVVDAAETVSSPSSELGLCLAGRIRTWRFPMAKQADAGFVVSYPFLFKRSAT